MRWLQNTGWWVTICVFLLGGPIIGVLAGRLASRLEHEQAWAVCSSYVAEHAADLLRETSELSEELFHLRSFFEAQPGITRDEFRLYTSQILKSHPAIQAIEWAPRVTAGERESFPILYAEPTGANVSAIGFDLSSERTRNAALTRAVQTRDGVLVGSPRTGAERPWVTGPPRPAARPARTIGHRSCREQRAGWRDPPRDPRSEPAR